MDLTQHRKLVADYSSSSEEASDDTLDSEPDSPPEEESESCSDASFKSDAGIKEELIKIEEIKISLPSEKCEEVGKVKFVVNEKVVVEPKVGLAALDLGTILFLEKGEKALGKVDETFGPITEPLYTVLFNKADDISALGVTVGTAVYYAPTTEHTSYVFLPDLLKMKGSDASWKHNQELPPEHQDDSDDSEPVIEQVFHDSTRRKKQVKKPSQSRGQGPRRCHWNPPLRPPVLPPFYPPHIPMFDSSVPPPVMPPPVAYNFPPPPSFIYPFMSPPPPPPPAQPGPSLVQDMRFWQKK